MTAVIQTIKETQAKIIGLKQTLRAIQQDKVKMVYIASDIEEHILRKIAAPCRERSIPLVPANLTQKELGRLCQIEVGAAIVALIT